MSAVWKLTGIGVFGLVLLIPLGMVNELIQERQQRLLEARDAIARRWAEPQILGGPVLRVASRKSMDTDRGRRQVEVEQLLLPESLSVSGSLSVETRYYGIYRQPVYIGTLEMSGTFSLSDFHAISEGGTSDALLQIPLSDIRGVRGSGRLTWGEETHQLDSDEFAGSSLTALATRVPIPSEGDSMPFRLSLKLAGTHSLQFIPLGKCTSVSLVAPWTDPGFIGAYLPDERRIDAEGFEATWQVLALNRRYAQVLLADSNWDQAIRASAFGVELFQPVSVYQRSERSIKYGALFIALTFLGYFVFETLAGVRMHPVQYLFLGLAMACFYLLLLALSEHLGFGPAFALAAIALCGLCGIYSAAILGDTRRGAAASGLLGAIYGLLYLLVVGEDYSLLVGSLALFAMLALAMLLTRHVDWYQIQQQRQPAVVRSGE